MDDIGIVKVDTGVGSGGVGYLVVPEEIDRVQYIEDCYRTQTVSINAGEGYGYFNAVRCPQNVLENLKFPTENNRGTPVLWIKDGMSHLPVIVGWLRKEGDYYALGENQWRTSRGNDKRNVEVFIDGNTSTLQINVLGDEEEPANVQIKLSSQNKDSVFNLSSDNELQLTGVNKTTLNSCKEIQMLVKEEGEKKFQMKYTLKEGFLYEDEFGNSIRCVDKLIEIKSEQINHNGGNEPMVLGNTLQEVLSDILTAIQKLTVISPTGATSVPVNVADFAKIQQRLSDIKSKKSNLE